MSWMHFERMAEEYRSARPPYPAALFRLLRTEGVIGPGLTVLEVGAGSGQATRELVGSGSRVTALEPGRRLAALLEQDVPGVPVISACLEDAPLPVAGYDSGVAATSLHWVDLSVGLARLGASIRPGGALAVFRHVFGDDGVPTDFRARVQEIVERRRGSSREPPSEARPTMGELAAGAWFQPVLSETWRWAVELSTTEVVCLFRTFSDWTEQEVRDVGAAADASVCRVTEHYRTVLHLLRRSDVPVGPTTPHLDG
jgi:SAM-dependent methyltransferase